MVVVMFTCNRTQGLPTYQPLNPDIFVQSGLAAPF